MAKAKSGKVQMQVPVVQNHHHSVDVRKIDNGYVTRHTHSGPGIAGGYREREVFSPTKPKVQVAINPPAKKK